MSLNKQDKRRRKHQITVNATKETDGGRRWDKAHYCLYCKQVTLKMAQHLECKHVDESEVAYAFIFPTGSKRRKMLLEVIRNKGDWEHKHVLETGTGEIVTWKRLSKKAHIEDYLPCQHCYAQCLGEKNFGNMRRLAGTTLKSRRAEPCVKTTRVSENKYKKCPPFCFHSVNLIRDYKT